MEVLENAMELVSGLAIFQSTTVAVLGMVSLLYLYRRLATPNQGSQLKAGEVKEDTTLSIWLGGVCVL